LAPYQPKNDYKERGANEVKIKRGTGSEANPANQIERLKIMSIKLLIDNVAASSQYSHLRARVVKLLKANQIKTLGDLWGYNPEQLLAIGGFGPKYLALIEDALAAQGLAFD